MNYLEFKRQLMVDPYDRSDAFEEALRTNSDCVEAVQQSDSFEALLQSAMGVPVPSNLVDLQAIQSEQSNTVRQVVGWLPAMAAGLAMGVGLTMAVFLFTNKESQSVQDHLADHWSKDGDITVQLAQQGPMNTKGVEQVLATLDLQAETQLLGDIAYARNCGTPHGDGVHMVMNTPDGVVTAIYMPEMEVGDVDSMHVAGNAVMFMQMEHGVLALVGSDEHNLGNVLKTMQSNLADGDHLET